MLTLPETIAAIRALSTEPDILSQACASVLRKSTEGLESNALAKRILGDYLPLIPDKSDLLIALITAAGAVGGSIVDPVRSRDALQGLQDLLADVFADRVSTRLADQFRSDPDKAMRIVFDIASQKQGKE